MVLAFAPFEKDLIVTDIFSGKCLNGRLNAIGVHKGTNLQIVNNSGGDLIIKVKDTKIAIGRGMAMKIKVDIA